MPLLLYSTKDPDVKNSDVHVKNKFKWAWLDKICRIHRRNIDDQKITQTVLLSDTIKNVLTPERPGIEILIKKHFW